jgi:hypothetical protein
MTYNKLVNGEIIPMTAQEIADRQAEEGAFVIAKSTRDKIEKRQNALAEKWPDAFALLDDILERGIDEVKTERAAIKAANPKGD